jgi:phospholipase C
MKTLGLIRYALTIGAATGFLTACGSGGGSSLPRGLSVGPQSGSPSSPIAHVVIIVQENRSFDDLFATFSGADGATSGCMKTSSALQRHGKHHGSGCPSGDQTVPLKKVPLSSGCDPGHGYHGFLRNLDGGNMDGFGLGNGACNGNVTAAYQYVDPKQIAPYWDMADQYVLGDHLLQTQGSGSFTAHQDLIAGGTMINAKQTISIVDDPTQTPWGCDAPQGVKTDELKWTPKNLQYLKLKGPFPCFTYSTLRDLLDAKSVSWRYYSPPVKIGQKNGEGALWNGFDAISVVRYGPEWGTNVTMDNTLIFQDIQNQALPAVSWVIPDRPESDHPAPGPGGDKGPSWVASLVNAIGESSFWPSTAIVVVWDDWGGFYDHEPPPITDKWGGLGFRVPMLAISPYAVIGTGSQGGYVSHTHYEFGSILKFVENTFGLGSLGKTDARAKHSIIDCFDFTQSPRPFQQIPSSYSRSYFIHKRPSLEPVDTE